MRRHTPYRQPGLGRASSRDGRKPAANAAAAPARATAPAIATTPTSAAADDRRYVPDVRPFMRQYGYAEGLEEILQEIERCTRGSDFLYESEDLWKMRGPKAPTA